MRKLAILTTTFALILAAAIPTAIAQDKQDNSKDNKGALGGVLDTLGSVLGTGTQKLHGTVVLVAEGSTFVLRTDDGRTYRVDTASLDPQKVSAITPGQTVTVAARGGGQAGVLTASELAPDAKRTGKTFQTVSGTVQQAGRDRVMFKTREGLVLPIDVGNINGLPYLAASQPATLYYEQGTKQEVVGVWIQPGSPQAAQTSPSASVSTTQSVEGVVESLAMSELKMRTTDGRSLTVDTSDVDRQALRGVAPGDTVTVTGAGVTTGERFVAQSVQPRR